MHTQSINTKPFVIFLDIDGVIHKTQPRHVVAAKVKELFPDTRAGEDDPELFGIASAHFFDKQALNHLDTIINEIQKIASVWIVISSSWRLNRSAEDLQVYFFDIHNFSHYVKDKTDDILSIDVKTICDNKDHLKEDDLPCRASEIKHFVVLDDMDAVDHLQYSFKEKFVKIDPKKLINSETVKKVLQVARPLSSTKE
jgi:hypothetical protein